MASLSNELESLSLDLPDVVAEAEAELALKRTEAATKITPQPTASRRRRPRRERKKPAAEAIDPTSDEVIDGACSLPDDQRVPEIALPEDCFAKPEASQSSIEAATVRKGGRSRRKRKGGKRKSEAPMTEPAAENKENFSKAETSKDEDDTSFPFADDSEDESEEPKYLWRNVTKNGDIKKCVLVDGKVSLGRPKPGDTVLVKAQGKLKDGTIVDDYPTMVFNVGEYEVIDGLDLVVQSMHKNELSIVSLKPVMAYGEKGRGNRAPCGRTEEHMIPANSRITYLFGLLHFEKSKDMASMTWAQRRKAGQQRLRLANWWYQRKEYPIAVKCYKKALLYYNDIPSNRECSTAEEYKELLQLMEERLRVMRQVANIFKRIANLIQSGHISV